MEILHDKSLFLLFFHSYYIIIVPPKAIQENWATQFHAKPLNNLKRVSNSKYPYLLLRQISQTANQPTNTVSNCYEYNHHL